MKRNIRIVAALLAALLVAGCANTLRGVGEDTQAAGRAIENAVSK